MCNQQQHNDSSESESYLKESDHNQARKQPDPETSCKRFKPDVEKDDAECQSEIRIPTGKNYTSESLESLNTSKLYNLLWDVDRERAERLQPNDRRKILR